MKTKTLKSTFILLSVILGLSLLIAFFTAAGHAVQKRNVAEMFVDMPPPGESWCLVYQMGLESTGQKRCRMKLWPSEQGYTNDPKDEEYNCGECPTCTNATQCKSKCIQTITAPASAKNAARITS